MKAQELRIGNYIYGVSDRIEQVIQLSETKVTTDIIKVNAPMEIELTDISSIELTEEWLLKFGFYIDSFKNYELGDININRLTFKLDIFEDDWHTIPVKMKYVHQLQNLYFALTGEELTIK